MDINIDIEGLNDTLAELEDTREDLTVTRAVTVGSGVSYAVFLEGGTSKMDAKPFFQPALAELRARGVAGFIREHTRTTVEALPDADSVVGVLGLALERRIKEIITAKGLIDTGTLRASVLAIPGEDPSDLPSAEDFSGFDSDTPAPASAGRAVASETVEIDTDNA